jgi:EmrB/QacA subfamily drug resistance transporter
VQESPRQHHNVTLAALVLAGTAYALQQTMVLPALPALQRDLHTTTTWATWIFTGFLLSSAVLTPMLGKLGDQHGKERLLAISLTVFLAGCIGAALAWNIWSLIAFRIVQGAGGAVFPLSFAIINDEFPREKSGAAIGAISAVFGVGGALGLPLSGLIVDNVSWRWLFAVAAVVVAAATAAVIALVPESPIKTPSKLDLPGATLLSTVLIAVLLALSEAPTWGWGSARTLALFGVAAVALAAWVVVELRVDQPLVDMRIMASRTVLFTNLTAMLAGLALFGAFVLVPQFAETPRGLSGDVARLVHYGFSASATKAGLYLLPGALLGFVSGPLAGQLGKRFGFKLPLALGMIFAAVGLAILAEWHDRPWQVVLGMTIAGGGIPGSFAAMAKLVVDAVRPSETGIASGVNTVMRTIGGVVGGQIAATVLANRLIPGTKVPTGSAYGTAFWFAFVAAVVGIGVALAVTPRARAGAVALETE